MGIMNTVHLEGLLGRLMALTRAVLSITPTMTAEWMINMILHADAGGHGRTQELSPCHYGADNLGRDRETHEIFHRAAVADGLMPTRSLSGLSPVAHGH